MKRILIKGTVLFLLLVCLFWALKMALALVVTVTILSLIGYLVYKFV